MKEIRCTNVVLRKGIKRVCNCMFFKAKIKGETEIEIICPKCKGTNYIKH